jgi:integrase
MELSYCPTFKAYSEEWIEVFKRPKVGEKWYTNILSLFRNHLWPSFGDRPIGSITKFDVQRFFNSRRKYAGQTLDKLRNLLSEIFDSALEDGYVRINPADSRHIFYEKKATERKPLTKNAAAELIKEVDHAANIRSIHESDRSLVYLAAYSGLRRGEIVALRWENVDLDNGYIYVKEAVTYIGNRPVEKGPKSKAGVRRVPICEELKAYLSRICRSGKYVVGGDHLLTDTELSRAYERIRKHASFTDLHTLRHTFGTQMSGCTTPNELKSIMGHADIETTLGIYVHETDDNAELNFKAVNSLYKVDAGA